MKIFDGIIDFLFPRICMSCGEITENGENICTNCKSELYEFSHKERCLRCGGTKPDCDCKNYIYYFNGLVSSMYNEGAAQSIVYKYKLSGRRHYAEFIAEKMIKALEEEYGNISFDYITFVPVSFKSRIKRGFDQSRILASIISRKTGIPVKTGLIGCKPFKPAQHINNLKERFVKVNNQYYVKNKYRAGNVLLVDDIKTTGATLNICAKMLLVSGADTVYCLSALGNKRPKQKSRS